MSEDIIICENLVKIYKTKDSEVLALQGLEINIAAGKLSPENCDSPKCEL